MHNEDPSFSVVIPTYNHADFLMNALQSVVDQKYDYWEAIVIDNNSSDHTDEVVKSFNDPRIKLYKINNNGVIGASRNLGIKLSNYNWIAFLDSDDKWYPNRLIEVTKVLSAPNNFDVISTNEYKVFFNKRKRKILRYGPLPNNAYEYMLLNGNKLSPSATIVKKSLLEEKNIYFNEGIDFITVEDYDFWLNLARVKAKFKFIPSIQGEYLVHSSNNSNREDIHYKNGIHLLKHHIFNIQSFNKDKERLWKRVECRLLINESISNLNKKNIRSFIFKSSHALFISPSASILYLFRAVLSMVRNYLFELKSLWAR
tara:strand:- start:104 stop:1045 length:942 start_codon:yes stop_codon:yes gene_type:complete